MSQADYYVVVTLGPAGAISAGAQWSVDGGANWLNTGEYADGDYAVVLAANVPGLQITFKTASGYVTPTIAAFPGTIQTADFNLSDGTPVNCNYGSTSLHWRFSEFFYLLTAPVYLPLLPPVAAFTEAPSPSFVGQSVVFTDASTNLPTSWLWDFGDGYGSALQNPTHTYAVAGTYTVSLTATNSAGVSSPVTYTQTVEAVPSYVAVTILPADAISIGAQWSSDGGATWHNSATPVLISPNNLQITLKTVSGYVTPTVAAFPSSAPLSNFDLSDGLAVTYAGVTDFSNSWSLTVKYPLNVGNLTVTIPTAEAVALGAMWSPDSGTTWNPSGATQTLAAGDYTITFTGLPCWVTPPNKMATVTYGQTTTVTGDAYTQICQFPNTYGVPLWHMVHLVQSWLGVAEDDFNRYSYRNIVGALNAATLEFCRQTNCLTMPVLIVCKANRQNYRLPYNALKVLNARYYTGSDSTSYQDLILLRDIEQMRLRDSTYKGTIGTPLYLFPSYGAGNVLNVGISPFPDTDGTPFDPTQAGVALSPTGDQVGLITGTHKTGYDSSPYLVDAAGRDLMTLGAIDGFPTTNSTQGQDAIIAGIGNAAATNDKLLGALTGSGLWQVGDVFQIPLSEYGVVLDLVTQQTFTLSHGALGDNGDMYASYGCISLDVSRKPTAFVTACGSQICEIPDAHVDGIIGYAVSQLGRGIYKGMVNAQKATDGMAVFASHVDAFREWNRIDQSEDAIEAYNYGD